MPRNVEIKARVIDPEQLHGRVRDIADDGPVHLTQDDTFFTCSNGRLKLRTFSESEGQLIFYQRPDSPEPKESCYTIVPTSSPEALRQTLASALGFQGRVRKTRVVYFVGNTRVHLDDVEGLGHFMELEVVLSDGDTVSQGITVAKELMARLGIEEEHLIEGAYVDLLAANA
jgi:predicted adenylyl cyclase CyaB